MHTLWFDAPARAFEESMLIGNGRLGAVVYGGVGNDTISFNHDTLWSGTPKDKDADRTIPVERIEEVFELLKAGKYYDAQCIVEGEMLGCNGEKYMPMASLRVHNQRNGQIFHYKRTLDMRSADVCVEYEREGWQCVPYVHRYFVSHPHNVCVMRLTCERNAISLSLSLDSELYHSVRVDGGDTLRIDGRAPLYQDGVVIRNADTPTIRFEMAAKVVTDGKLCASDTRIHIEDASEVTVYIAADTSFVDYQSQPNQPMDCLSYIDAAVADGYDAVYAAHVRDHRALYDRTSLTLHGDGGCADLPTDKRIARYKDAPDDNGLAALMWNFGRYLLIAASRPGTQAANLQGIWNYQLFPPWSSNYTANINLEMNYWLAETCNLSECHAPLFDLVRDVAEAGTRTARERYGCGGFAANHNIDLWRNTTPVEGYAMWAYWPMSGGWLCRHLFDHVQFTNDADFARDTAYPLTEQCAAFYLDWLRECDGHLVTPISTSPENTFVDEAGRYCAVTIGSTMDLSIIKETFVNLLTLVDMTGMGHDSAIVTRVRDALPRLYPFQIGGDGRLLEWRGEQVEREPGHRHVSHLYGLYPASLITHDTPDLFEAARASLEYRLQNGGGHTGWSCAWIINLFARLRDGAKAGQYIDQFLRKSTYPNMLCSHPPFQIDGNYGYSAGVAEMLLQSHGDGGIVLLPALPDKWRSGSARGLCARGGYTVDLAWEDGRVTSYGIVKDGQTVASECDVCHAAPYAVLLG